MPKRGPCAEWPNCECPKCDRHRVRLDYIQGIGVNVPKKVIGACHYCGGVATTRDHMTPKSKGGGGGRSNLVPACYSCNQRKGQMGYREFMKLMGNSV